MRVALVTESFFPQVNGVTNTVRHVVDRLVATGHQVLIVAPGPGLSRYRDVPVVRVRSMGVPGHRSFPLGLPDPALDRALERVAPDLVHVASPALLGAAALRTAQRLGVPSVAVYQTDLAGFARQYGVRAETLMTRWVGRIHRRATRTLVPSTASWAQLSVLGVPDIQLWRRGVSLDLFAPRHRDPLLHARWAAGPDRVVVGYVGRLAPEKQVHRLAEVSRVPGVSLVVVGDGPSADGLRRQLPQARFTGMLRGQDLARAFASLDAFVHTGEAETFCQTVQEAQASGVPVVAPAAGGPLDLVDHGRTGLLYDPADPRSLRRNVALMVGNPLMRAMMARQGVSEVASRSWTAVVDELVEHHYGAVLGARRQDRAA
jgi:phosphatidylinositol alpha 1,6-mannosyltransferase